MWPGVCRGGAAFLRAETDKSKYAPESPKSPHSLNTHYKGVTSAKRRRASSPSIERSGAATRAKKIFIICASPFGKFFTQRKAKKGWRTHGTHALNPTLCPESGMYLE